MYCLSKVITNEVKQYLSYKKTIQLKTEASAPSINRHKHCWLMWNFSSWTPFDKIITQPVWLPPLVYYPVCNTAVSRSFQILIKSRATRTPMLECI